MTNTILKQTTSETPLARRRGRPLGSTNAAKKAAMEAAAQEAHLNALLHLVCRTQRRTCKCAQTRARDSPLDEVTARQIRQLHGIAPTFRFHDYSFHLMTFSFQSSAIRGTAQDQLVDDAADFGL